MERIKHTLLFEERRWSLRGSYVEADGQRVEMTGEYKVSHGPDAWRIETTVRLLLDEPIEYRNDFALGPLAGGSGTSPWTAASEVMGGFSGTFTVIEDAIVSVFRGDDDRHDGAETLWIQGDGSYLVRGVLRRGGEVISAWRAILRSS